MTNNYFYGEKLRLARLLKGITQQQLGKLITTSRQFVHQLESGARQPAQDVLEVLCEVLNVHPSFFCEQISNDVKFEQCHFRKRKTTPIGLANRVLAYSTIFEQLVAYLKSEIEFPGIQLPNVDDNDSKHSNVEIEKAAEECRRMWGLGIDRPISNITKALENFGIVITQFSGVSDKVDALSVNRKHPIIVRNDAKESVCRMRFDLSHECGHFVLHDGIETGDSVTEKEADKFASAFIFPRVAFHKEFPDLKRYRLDWNLIYGLKMRWGLSARAIIYRAHFLDRISAQQYRSANVWLNKTGQSRFERYDDQISPENPVLIINAISLLKKHYGISFSDIAERLGIKPHLLSIITGIQPENQTSNNKITPLFKMN